MSKLFYSFFINNLPNLSIKKYLKNKRPWANILFVLLSCRPNCYKTTKVKITKDHTNNIFKTIKSIGSLFSVCDVVNQTEMSGKMHMRESVFSQRN